jgi:uncharacterized protein YgbK (DUF1537 family)
VSGARIRLLADDLTGALDAAAPFASLRAPVPVTWWPAHPDGDGDLALDAETRDLGATAAARRVEDLAPGLRGAAIAFKKLDSLLRGHPFVELAACLRGGGFASAVVTPAFPAQDRITRCGRQLVRDTATGDWLPIGPDLAVGLAQAGLGCEGSAAGSVGQGPRVLLCDAESEADLARIAERGALLPQPVLWCGSAGLARAIAAPAAPSRPAALARPLLILIGSAHPRTRGQVARLREDHLAVLAWDGTTALSAVDVSARLKADGVAIVALDLAPETPMAAARLALVRLVAHVAASATVPGTAIVSGGETLMVLVHALATGSLLVDGELMPGLPRSVMQGGAWSGTTVVSKAGGFGAPDALLRLIAASDA